MSEFSAIAMTTETKKKKTMVPRLEQRCGLWEFYEKMSAYHCFKIHVVLVVADDRNRLTVSNRLCVYVDAKQRTTCSQQYYIQFTGRTVVHLPLLKNTPTTFMRNMLRAIYTVLLTHANEIQILFSSAIRIVCYCVSHCSLLRKFSSAFLLLLLFFFIFCSHVLRW